MADVQWYYARNDQQFGPVSASELKQLADAGRLAPDDLLWREGMDTWATAVNLRGLFAPESTGTTTATATAVSRPLPAQGRPAESMRSQAAPSGVALRNVLRITQLILWTTCVLVVLLGMVLFTRAFLLAESAAEEAQAAAVFATFFLGAYVLARSGEKISQLLLARSRR